jgi:LEA14-like dessication related protein
VVSTKAAVVGGIVLLAVLVGGAALYFTGGDLSFDEPTIQSVETEFGAVSAERTEVQTAVVVDNPNNQSFPGSATLTYDIYMNSVQVSSGTEGGVGLDPGRNSINFTANLDNSKIPAWWVTHVNSDERTVVSTRASVGVAGFDRSLPPQNRTIETNLLGAFTASNTSNVTIADRRILVVSNRTAAWGTANDQRTPIEFSTGLRNTHDQPVRLDGTEYRIVMNNVTVGEGRTDDSIRLDPGENSTFTTRAALDTPAMENWWVDHLRNRQTTDLRVEVFGLVRDDGELKRVPLNVFDRELRFRTDFLGPNGTRTEQLDTGRTAPTFTEPTVRNTSAQWGEVTDERTEIETTVAVSNPNEGSYNDLLSLGVEQTTEVNNVTFARNETTVEQLPTGNGSFGFSSYADSDAVPQWWSRHINNGERSTVVTTADGTADIGITTLPVDLPDRRTTQETSVIEELNSDENEPVEADGRTVLTITETRAEWGRSTPERAPLEVTVTARNENTLSEVTVSRLEYVVDINDVRLADNASTRSYTIPPGATRELTYTLYLDNQQMDEWWPTHVRNDERSVLTTNTTAVIETRRGTERATFDIFGNGTVIETDFLGNDPGTADGADDESTSGGSDSTASGGQAARAVRAPVVGN